MSPSTPAFRALKTGTLWHWECRAQLIPGESAAMQWKCFCRSPLIRVSTTGSWCAEERVRRPCFLSHPDERDWTKISRVWNAHRDRDRSRGQPPPSYWLYYAEASLWIRILRVDRAEIPHRAALRSACFISAHFEILWNICNANLPAKHSIR